MTPSIGRVVHYVSYGTPGGEYKSECRAAVVTEVDPVLQTDGSHSVGLCVLNPTGQFFNRGVHYHDGKGEPGDLDCPNYMLHSTDGPHRYCAPAAGPRTAIRVAPGTGQSASSRRHTNGDSCTAPGRLSGSFAALAAVTAGSSRTAHCPIGVSSSGAPRGRAGSGES